MHGWRTFLAFLLAPLAVPLIMVLVVLVEVRPEPEDLAVGLASTALFYSAFGYVGVLLVGVPMYRFLWARNWTAFRVAPVAGFAAGAFFGMFVFLVLWSIGLAQGGLANILATAAIGLFCGLCGVLVGVLLWLIARPDRQTRVAGTDQQADAK
jgi:hypothetical protein